jgi:hypothetical protein
MVPPMTLDRLRLSASLLLAAAPLAAQEPERATFDAVVRGVVYDSIARAPLAGAMVQLVPDAADRPLLTATSDTAGRWEITGVAPGTYLAGYFHEHHAALGVRSRVLHVAVAEHDTLELAMAVPSGESVYAALCPARQKSDSTGLVLGYVRDADTGVPLVGSTVVLMWPEMIFGNMRVRTEVRQVAARSDADGWFAVCGIPYDGDVTIRAEMGADSSGFVAIAVPPRGTVRQTLRIGRGNATVAAVADSRARGATHTVRRGTARLAGRVLLADGSPAQDAQLSLWGSDAATTSDVNGSFALAALPAGTYTLEARLLGFEPARVGVQLSRDSTTRVTVYVANRIPVLETVTVFGKRRTSPLTRALHRRERGVGSFFTRADIERQGFLQTTDLLRRVAGVRVVPSRGTQYLALMRGNCLPMLWVDGTKYPRAEDQLQVMPAPQEIAIMEVYSGPESPTEFAPGGCGAIVIWTGR